METAQDVLDYLREQEQALVGFLERLALAGFPSAEPASQDEVLGALSGLGYRAWRVPGAEAAAISTRGPNGADAARRRNSFSETATPSGRSGRWRRCRLGSRTASSRAPASTT